ncbi:MAG: glycosyltransferase family 2 protein [Nitrososphaerales archaeon]
MEPVPDNLTSDGGIWAVGTVRDEVDIIGSVVSNLLEQGVERVLIADNLSTDGTGEVLDAISRSSPVTVLSDALPAHYQGEKVTLLARAARRAGASWVVPFDADEIWLAPGSTLADWLGERDAAVVQVPVFNHVPTLADDTSTTDPVTRLRWRKTKPNRLHKVAFRPCRGMRVAQGNHGVRRGGPRERGLEIRHFPYRSEDQFVRKLLQGGAAIAATDLSAEVGKTWRNLGARDAEALRTQWRSYLQTHNLANEWWVPREGLVEDPVVLGRNPRETAQDPFST